MSISIIKKLMGNDMKLLKKSVIEQDIPETGPRRKAAWHVPTLRILLASNAENGIDPIIPDGPLSFGS